MFPGKNGLVNKSNFLGSFPKNGKKLQNWVRYTSLTTVKKKLIYFDGFGVKCQGESLE